MWLPINNMILSNQEWVVLSLVTFAALILTIVVTMTPERTHE
jgi:hypothetical protein